MDLIVKYFPSLTAQQKEQFAALQGLYSEWNEKINVVSRKDIENLYERHILHSLAIAKIIEFAPQTAILDVGSGGGFPGIPLAIMFPHCEFHLIDAIAKKVKVIAEVAKAAGLTNVVSEQVRVENLSQQYDFVVSRAVCAFPEFVQITKRSFKKEQHNVLGNGILYLKGGDLTDELKGFLDCSVTPISSFFAEEFFETKQVVYLQHKGLKLETGKTK